MITIVMRDRDSKIGVPFSANLFDITGYHPLDQMEMIKRSHEGGHDTMYWTNHQEIVWYIGYLIRNKMAQARDFMLDTECGMNQWTDKGDLLAPYYSDIDSLTFNLLFGKKGDFEKGDLDIGEKL